MSCGPSPTQFWGAREMEKEFNPIEDYRQIVKALFELCDEYDRLLTSRLSVPPDTVPAVPRPE